MHEMSLTRNAIEVVLRSAEQADVRKVKTVHVSIGDGRDVIEPLFEKYFHYLARGTIAEDAEIAIRQVPLMLGCRACGCVYPVDQRNQGTWPCPDCGKKDYELVSGMEFSIDSIDAV